MTNEGIEPFWLRNVPADEIQSDDPSVAPNDLALTTDFPVAGQIQNELVSDRDVTDQLGPGPGSIPELALDWRAPGPQIEPARIIEGLPGLFALFSHGAAHYWPNRLRNR